MSQTETSVDGLRSWQTKYRDATTPVTSSRQTVYAGGGNRYVTNASPDGSYTVEAYMNGRLTSSTRKDAQNAQVQSTSYTYDPHGRRSTAVDARNGATTYGYNNADLVTSTISPNPGTSGGSPQTNLTYYNAMLQATNVVQPDGTSVTSVYLLSGELSTNSGSRIYPVAYTYDYAGRMKTMVTWKNFSANSGMATTTWNYDAYRGLLIAKTYDGGAAGPAYTYTPAGRLKTRTWARNIITTYSYDNGGSLAAVVYSDGTTPNATYSFDRLGRQSTITCNGMTDTLAYNTADELLNESFSGGTLNGLALTNGYDAFLRRTAVGLSTQPSTLTTYAYDAAGRLQSVANGNNTATYGYVANSPLVGQITFQNGGVSRMTTTKTYDFLNRLTSIGSVNAQSSALDSHSYGYNSANQRTSMTNLDNSRWVYQYDGLGQVTNAVKYWSDGSPVAGQQFGYAFDTIGNRQSTAAGGDQTGANLRSASYTANNQNQYSSRTVPNAVDITGSASNTATVTVNGQAAYRKNDYYWLPLGIGNGSGPVYQSVTNTALLSQGSYEVSSNTVGNIFVPQSTENFTYDADGNLSTDSRWTYTWDAENHLSTMVARTAVGPQQSLKFEYDSQGRRIGKKVWNNTTFNGTPAVELKFLYDRWNLVSTFNSAFALQTAFVWGLDLSGSIQGGGGVGGLLEVNDTANGAHFAFYDGNGNVAGLVKAADSTLSAKYEYAPFGEVIRATGPFVKINPFRLSTKYQDEETDLLYYGYRYYAPTTARWLSRDPIQEKGGKNLYEFVNNDPLEKSDPLGRNIADLANKLRGKQVPKAVGVSLGGTFVLKLPWVSGPFDDNPLFSLVVGLNAGVYFFPDSCELAAYSIRAGLGNNLQDWQSLTSKNDLGQDYELGLYGSLGAAVESAGFIGSSTPGVANADSFLGLFHTFMINGPDIGATVYIGDTDPKSGGRWVGGTVGIGPGFPGVAIVDWNYQYLTKRPLSVVTLPKCLCYALIAQVP